VVVEHVIASGSWVAGPPGAHLLALQAFAPGSVVAEAELVEEQVRTRIRRVILGIRTWIHVDRVTVGQPVSGLHAGKPDVYFVYAARKFVLAQRSLRVAGQLNRKAFVVA